MCAGSVHTFHTSSRGASKTREITNSCSVDGVEGLFSATMIPLLFLQLMQIIVQPIETLLPETTVLPHPIGNLLEPLRLKPAGPPLSLAAARNQAGAFEHLEMFGDSRQTHFERLRQLRYRRFAAGKPRKNRAPCGIGECRKGGAQMILP